MITFKKPEWIEEPGDIRLHAELILDAGIAAHSMRPCPFCASPHMNVSNTHTPVFTVICENCGAEIHGDYHGARMPFATRAAALRAYRRAYKSALSYWNIRDGSPLNETLCWHHQGKPDEGETVIAQSANHEIDCAFVNEGKWHWVSGGLIDSEVLYWAAMPEGIMTRDRKESRDEHA